MAPLARRPHRGNARLLVPTLTLAAAALALLVGRPGGAPPAAPRAPAAAPRATGKRGPATALPWHLPRHPSRPLRILVVGDSLGEDLAIGLADVLAGERGVVVVDAAIGSSGLVDTAYYDWPAAFARDLAAERPDVVVALFGGNDAVSFDAGGRYVPFGSPLWRSVYGARVAGLLRAAAHRHAFVVWVGLPVMAPWSVLPEARVRTLNALYAALAARHGALFVSTWDLFRQADGRFALTLGGAGGTSFAVRDPDGVHIALPAGAERLATAVLAALDRRLRPPLCPIPADPWPALVPRACRAPAVAHSSRPPPRRPTPSGSNL